MAQSASLLSTLKSCLKQRGYTYADVAQWLDLSQASVKRIFAEQNISLQRLESICQKLGLDITDLVKQMEASRERITQLTHAQEHEIIEDLELALVNVCVFNHWTAQQISDYFLVSPEKCTAKLLTLDKIGIIELMAENRIKLLISTHFHWIANGPFERFFREHIGKEYFSSAFDGKSQCLRVLNGTFSAASAQEFQRKIERLAEEFSHSNAQDASLPFNERSGVTLVMAMRNWDYGLFEHLIRPEHKPLKSSHKSA